VAGIITHKTNWQTNKRTKEIPLVYGLGSVSL
jgi:hypothetical protein